MTTSMLFTGQQNRDIVAVALKIGHFVDPQVLLKKLF